MHSSYLAVSIHTSQKHGMKENRFHVEAEALGGKGLAQVIYRFSGTAKNRIQVSGVAVEPFILGISPP